MGKNPKYTPITGYVHLIDTLEYLQGDKHDDLVDLFTWLSLDEYVSYES